MKNFFSSNEFHPARINIVCAAVQFGTHRTFVQWRDEPDEFVTLLFIEVFVAFYQVTDFF